MQPIRAILALAVAVGLGACAQVDDVTRAAPLSPLVGPAGAGAMPAVSRDYKVAAVDVEVPATLVVGESNSYMPRGDIVWREDGPGDRYAQVGGLITEALTGAVADLDGAREVRLAVVVTRFHALSEKARFGVPSGLATHDVQMTLAVLDAATGEVIEAARPVGFRIAAHTSDDAIADMARGITQRSRISEALAILVRRELGAAG